MTRSAKQIVRAAGGPKAISDATNGNISKWAPEKWCQSGVIPEEWWKLLEGLTEVNCEELHNMNVAARQEAAAAGAGG